MFNNFEFLNNFDNEKLVPKIVFKLQKVPFCKILIYVNVRGIFRMKKCFKFYFPHRIKSPLHQNNFFL